MNAYLMQALDRAIRTALQVLLGYFVAAQTIGGVDWATAAGATILAVLVSLLQAAVDLPPLVGVWQNILARALRTFAQTALGSVGAAVLITQVPWQTVLSAAALAALASVVNSLIALPLGSAAVKGTPEIVAPVHHVRAA